MNEENILIIGSIQIEKICRNGEFSYLKFKDLEDPDCTWIEWPDGTKEWCLNDKFHREGGPAREYSNGNKYWYLNGYYHREDGPAIEYASGTKYWYLNGKQLTEGEHQEQTKA